jgi:hypothetical protein
MYGYGDPGSGSNCKKIGEKEKKSPVLTPSLMNHAFVPGKVNLTFLFKVEKAIKKLF